MGLIRSYKENKMMGRDLNWWFRKGLLGVTHPDLLLLRGCYNVNRCIADTLSGLGYYKYPHRIIFLAGMAMSGSTWVKNLLAHIPGYFTRTEPMPREIASQGGIVDSFFNYVPKRGYSLFKTHIVPSRENLDCLFRNDVKKILVTYRDLRDVAVARYYRLSRYPFPGYDSDHKFNYSKIDKEKALEDSIEVVAKRFVPWIRGWFKNRELFPERFLFFTFEELKGDTAGTFEKMLKFYDISISPDMKNKIIIGARGKGTMVQNIEASGILPWGYSSNFRLGKIRGWEQEFTKAHIRKCKDLFGDALVELGYEKDLNW